MSATFLTVVVPFPEACEDAAFQAIHTLGNPAGPAVEAAIGGLGHVHFMSMCVAPPAGGKARFLIEASSDAPKARLIAELAEALRPRLEAILTAAGLPEAGYRDLPAFLTRHAVDLKTTLLGTMFGRTALGLPFCGSPGLPVKRILDEMSLAGRIATMRPLLYGNGLAHEKLDTVRAELWREGTWKWAFTAEQAPFLGPKRPRTAWISAMILLASIPALLWPLLIVPIVIWIGAWLLGLTCKALIVVLMSIVIWAGIAGFVYWKLRKAEATDEPDDKAPTPEHVASVMAGENHHALNPMAAVSYLKPRWLRPLVLRGVLWAVGQSLTRSGRPGFLGDIATVHYARWVLLPGTDQLVFFSNYDGSWESYLEDFINLISYGLTGVWSNCQGFPRTHLIFTQGAADGDRFRRWQRRQQIPTPFWYAAYPDLTLEQMRDNAAIRRGLASARTEAEAEAWLALFGAPSPPFAFAGSETA